jgi:hypothetical protein
MKMKLKLIPLIAAIGAIALALTVVSTSQAGKSGIINTDHDLASPGSPTCEHCHLPHRSLGMYLWAMAPDPDYTGDSVMLPLCYSCHDNTVANGSYIPDAEHNHPMDTPAWLLGREDYEANCKKCMEPDCAKCHDAHDDTWVFLDSERFDPWDYDGDTVPEDFMNASICAWCHEGDHHGMETWEEIIPVPADGDPEVEDDCGNEADDDGDGVADDGCVIEQKVPHTTHPEMVSEPEGAENFDPPAGANLRWWGDVGDLLGTRLWTDAPVYSNHIGLDDTQQYVVEEGEGPGDIRCMTCHTTHAGEEAELETMGYSDFGIPMEGETPETGAECANELDDDADTVVNDGCVTDPAANSAICINCHE